MTRPVHSLSTLRSAGCPDTTQDSLPAAGQLFRAGVGAPQGSIERFLRCGILLPQAFLAHPPPGTMMELPKTPFLAEPFQWHPGFLLASLAVVLAGAIVLALADAWLSRSILNYLDAIEDNVGKMAA